MKLRSVLVSLGLLGVLASGCSVQVDAKSKTRFVNNGNVTKSSGAWANRTIIIEDDAVGASAGGGLFIRPDANAQNVSISATVLALANAEEKANADKSIADVIQTIVIEETPTTITIRCGHPANDYGSSSKGEAGCEEMNVVVPAGSLQTPVQLQAKLGNGDLKFFSAVTGNIYAENRGSGDVEVRAIPQPGADVTAIGKFDVTAYLPADFKADKVEISSDGARIDTSEFPDVKPNEGRGGAGGARSIKVTSSSSLENVTVALKKL